MVTLAITGAGCVLPGAPAPDLLWQCLLAGHSAIGPHANEGVSSSRPIPYGHVDGAQCAAAQATLPHKLKRYASRCAEWGVLASRQALAQAGWPARAPAPERCGVFASQADSANPSAHSFSAALRALAARGEFCASALAREVLERNGAHPFYALHGLANNLLAMASLAFTLRGDCGAFVEDDGLAALDSAAFSLQHGDCELALVTCAGHPDEPLALASRAADDAVPGEGAVAFVLETRDRAAQRGARPLALLSGIGRSSAEGPDAWQHSLALARERCGIATSAIDALVGMDAGAPDVLRAALPPELRQRPLADAASLLGQVPGCPVGVLVALLMLQHQQLPAQATRSACEPHAPHTPRTSRTSHPPQAMPAAPAAPAALLHVAVLSRAAPGLRSALLLSAPPA